MIELFHFLRPAWLLALPLLVLVMWTLRRRGLDSGHWRRVIDPRLLPHVLSGKATPGQQRMPWLFAAAVAIGIVALAGPTWEKREQSVYRQQGALVIALDLSRSMNATDVRPSRLVRARHKIADILKLRSEGQSALLVYAADAFTVTPLTSDVETILAMLPDLEPALMPAQGTRADRAFERALELLDNGEARQGDLLLVTDGFSRAEIEGVETLLERHDEIRVSVLAIGSVEGGPVPLENGGFLKDADGNIVIARLNPDELRHIAELGGGAYTTLSADDLDVNTLSYLMDASLDAGGSNVSDRSADLWRELGPSLLLLALPLAALAFRRGVLWFAPLCLLVLPPPAEAIDWQSLWQNDDQRALELYDQGRHREAAELFSDESWRAAASYRAGDFITAGKEWEALDGQDAAYNHATALARQGRYEDALAAYDRLLEQDPGHEDAAFNRKAIEDWLEQQRQAQQQQGQQGEESGESNQDGAGTEGEEQQSSPRQARDDAGEESRQAGSDADRKSREQSRQGGQGRESEPESMGSEEEQEQQAQARSARKEAQAEAAEGASADEMQANLDQQMSDQATQQWLRKIPEDPGGLLRRKFLYQYRQRGDGGTETQKW